MADLAAPRVRLLRFGPFELDVRAGELRKHSIRIKLREQPVQILLMLLQHPGEVVLREEIQMRLWPNNTIVEFDHGINAAIKKLRDALGESADAPRYVETVARRGYRFLGEVQKIGELNPERQPLVPPVAADDDSLAGQVISHYRILATLGTGGMGVVYRARDSKLNRDVAIKVLPVALANDADYTARFQREAQVLASMNHPNIAAVYGLEDHAIVMELVEGSTLADRVAQGPLSIEETVPIAKQITEALEAAHEKGIIHRDLKPGNIKVTPDGIVKVLDFGLAKAAGAERGSDASPSPALAIRATEPELILGTPAYMSPEQASGKPVDRRADIWSFGVVLWEMLTGRQLFEGETISDRLAHVLTAPINFKQLPAGTPSTICYLLRRCLDRDIKTRLRDIGEARIALQEFLARPAGVSEVSAPANNRPIRLSWYVAGALTLLLFVTGLGWYRATGLAPPKQLVRLDLDLGGAASDVVLSPDGMRVAYVSKGKLFTRQLDQPNATELTGTEGAAAPFFSPDGQWIAFFTTSSLNKISVDGGAAVALCTVVNPRGGSWSEDGNIILAGRLLSALSEVPAAGGTPVALTELAQGELTQRWPQVLPGGRAVIFTAHTSNARFDDAYIDVMTLVNRRRKTLVKGGTFGRFVASPDGSGHLLYISRGTLFAVPFDLDRLEVYGTPVAMLEQVAYSQGDGSAQVAFTNAGTLVYRSGGAAGGGLATVQWLDSAGTTHPLIAKPDAYFGPRFSPDGQRLAISTHDVWVYEWKRDTMPRLTFDGGDLPAWSPDGRYIAFRKISKGMFFARSDGAGKPQALIETANQLAPYSFTPDGKRLAFLEVNPKTGMDLWTVPLQNDGASLRAGKPEPFLQTQFSERSPEFSPDGKWLAYDSYESGTPQVYVRAFPDNGSKWQVSSTGGQFPMWSRNAHELFFRNLERQIMFAKYTIKGDSFMAEKSQLWSEVHLAAIDIGRGYDLEPDGKRMAVLMPVEEAQQPQSRVIYLENFFDELRRRVPSK